MSSDKPPRPATPELDKQAKIQRDAATVSEFLDWLRDSPQYHYQPEGRAQRETVPCGLIQLPGTLETLLADYFEIDLDARDRERETLMAWLLTYEP